MRDFLREYLDELENRMERILSEQREMIDKAARMMADQIKADKLIYVFGSGGHSNMMAEEMFHRAGGLACISPVFADAIRIPHIPFGERCAELVWRWPRSIYWRVRRKLDSSKCSKGGDGKRRFR